MIVSWHAGKSSAAQVAVRAVVEGADAGHDGGVGSVGATPLNVGVDPGAGEGRGQREPGRGVQTGAVHVEHRGSGPVSKAANVNIIQTSNTQTPSVWYYMYLAAVIRHTFSSFKLSMY